MSARHGAGARLPGPACAWPGAPARARRLPPVGAGAGRRAPVAPGTRWGRNIPPPAPKPPCAARCGAACPPAAPGL